MYEQYNPWEEPSAGLKMIANAMVIQLLVVACTLLMVLYMLAAKKADGMETIAMLLAAVAMVAQLILVTGVFKFARQPAPAPSAGMAQSAGAFGIIGMALSGYVLFTLLQVSSVTPESSYEAIDSAMEAAERLPKLEVVAAVVGFIAMVLLLAAAGSVAANIRRLDVERKAKTAIAMVLLAAALYAFVKLGISPTEPTSIIAVLVMTATVQIAAFVNILGTVRGLSDALLHPQPPDLPRARSL